MFHLLALHNGLAIEISIITTESKYAEINNVVLCVCTLDVAVLLFIHTYMLTIGNEEDKKSAKLITISCWVVFQGYIVYLA